MLNVNEFKAEMVRNGYTQEKLAEALGMSAKTLRARMKKRNFGADEIEKLVKTLKIRDPMAIFFAGMVTCEVTNDSGRKEV